MKAKSSLVLLALLGTSSAYHKHSFDMPSKIELVEQMELIDIENQLLKHHHKKHKVVKKHHHHSH